MPGKKVSRNAQLLLTELYKKNTVSTQEAVSLLDVSEATARRLFHIMAESGTVLRTLGGVSLPHTPDIDYSYDQLAAQRTEAKMQIAQKACALCRSGDILYLDAGTTLALFAQALRERIRGGGLKDIRVYTNALNTVETLSHSCEVSLVGGRWRENRRDFCGHLAEDTLQRLHFTTCFLGADACEPRGLTTTDFESARLNEIAASVSNSRYTLADAGKFTRTSFVPYAALSQMTAILTDSGLDSVSAAKFRAKGAHLL